MFEKYETSQKSRKSNAYLFFVLACSKRFRYQNFPVPTFKSQNSGRVLDFGPLHGSRSVPWIMKHLLQAVAGATVFPPFFSFSLRIFSGWAYGTYNLFALFCSAFLIRFGSWFSLFCAERDESSSGM